VPNIKSDRPAGTREFFVDLLGVITRGGGYFFTPRIQALQTIAAGGWL
jgi:hypothetical protein